MRVEQQPVRAILADGAVQLLAAGGEGGAPTACGAFPDALAALLAGAVAATGEPERETDGEPEGAATKADLPQRPAEALAQLVLAAGPAGASTRATPETGVETSAEADPGAAARGADDASLAPMGGARVGAGGNRGAGPGVTLGPERGATAVARDGGVVGSGPLAAADARPGDEASVAPGRTRGVAIAARTTGADTEPVVTQEIEPGGADVRPALGRGRPEAARAASGPAAAVRAIAESARAVPSVAARASIEVMPVAEQGATAPQGTPPAGTAAAMVTTARATPTVAAQPPAPGADGVDEGSGVPSATAGTEAARARLISRVGDDGGRAVIAEDPATPAPRAGHGGSGVEGDGTNGRHAGAREGASETDPAARPRPTVAETAGGAQASPRETAAARSAALVAGAVVRDEARDAHEATRHGAAAARGEAGARGEAARASGAGRADAAAWDGGAHTRDVVGRGQPAGAPGATVSAGVLRGATDAVGRAPREHASPAATPPDGTGGQGLEVAAARILGHLERGAGPELEVAAARIATQLERAPWAERLADALRATVVRGGGEMRLALEPEGLGHIDVRITLHHDGLRAVILAEHDATRGLLAAQQHLLHAALERSAIRLAGFSVDLGFAGGDAGAFADSQAWEGQGTTESPVAPHVDTPPEPSVPASPPEPGRLSVRV